MGSPNAYHDPVKATEAKEKATPFEQRVVDEVVYAKVPGEGWPDETRALLKQGDRLVYNFQRFNQQLRDAATDKRSDRGLQRLFVLLGAKTPTGQGTVPESIRNSLRKSLGKVEADALWEQVEQKGTAFLQEVVVDMATNGVSKERLMESDELTRTAQVDTMLLSSKLAGKKKPKLSRKDKALLERRKKLQAENQLLQQQFDADVRAKLVHYDASFKQLSAELDKLNKHHRTVFEPCFTAAREHVLVPLTDKPTETIKATEAEKVNSMLLLGVSSLESTLQNFVKKYINFQASGGRQQAEMDSSGHSKGFGRMTLQRLLEAKEAGEEVKDKPDDSPIKPES